MPEPTATPPAVTPPAIPPAGGQPQPTPVPATAPGSPPAPAPIIMNQEQFDQRWAEKMGSLEKELGLQPGGLKGFIEAQKKPAPVPAASTETLTGAELRLAKMEALMLAKVPSEKIPGLLSRVQGKSKADIEADIQQMIKDGFLVIEKPAAQPQQQQPPAPVGASSNPSNPVPGTPRRWKKSEINAMTLEQIQANLVEIEKAEKEGRIDYHL